MNKYLLLLAMFIGVEAGNGNKNQTKSFKYAQISKPIEQKLFPKFAKTRQEGKENVNFAAIIPSREAVCNALPVALAFSTVATIVIWQDLHLIDRDKASASKDEADFIVRCAVGCMSQSKPHHSGLYAINSQRLMSSWTTQMQPSMSECFASCSNIAHKVGMHK